MGALGSCRLSLPTCPRHLNTNIDFLDRTPCMLRVTPVTPRQNAPGYRLPVTSDGDTYGTARPGGSPAGRPVCEIHASKRFPSPTRRMMFAFTPPLCADRPRLSSIFDLSTVELYRSTPITAQTFFVFHGSFHPTNLFPIPSPANRLQQLSHLVACMSNHAATCTYPVCPMERQFARDSPSQSILAARHALPRLASSKGFQSQSFDRSVARKPPKIN